MSDGQLVYKQLEMVQLTAPYIPGFLAFREVDSLICLYNTMMSTAPQYKPHVSQTVFVSDHCSYAKLCMSECFHFLIIIASCQICFSTYASSKIIVLFTILIIINQHSCQMLFCSYASHEV